MKIKINFNYLDNLLKKIGASEKKIKIDNIIDEYVSKLHSDDGLEFKSFDEISLDENGLLTAHGERIVVYIYDTHRGVDHLLNTPKVDKYPKFHIHGRCRTLLDMKNKGRYESRYIMKAKPDGLFTVEGQEGGTFRHYGRANGDGQIKKLEKVPLGICMNCLKEVGIKDQKSNHEWSETFDIKKFFEKCGPLPKPEKTSYTEYTFPPKEKKYDNEFKRKSKKMKRDLNYKCSKCGVDLNGSLENRKLLHTHHMDGNDRFHPYKNLQILCICCHSEAGDEKNLGFKGQYQKCLNIKHEQGITE